MMIEVENLTKYFGPILAVRDVSFQVENNEIVGLLGNNGAGKSTIMRILTTFYPATSGTARVGGFDVMNDSMEVRKQIGYLPESIPLYPEMRVEEYLNFRARLGNFVKEKRPPVGQFELAGLGAVSPRECPLLMTEEFAFENGRGER